MSVENSFKIINKDLEVLFGKLSVYNDENIKETIPQSKKNHNGGSLGV